MLGLTINPMFLVKDTSDDARTEGAGRIERTAGVKDTD